MTTKKFIELDNKFAKIQTYLEKGAVPGSVMDLLFKKIMGQDRSETMSNANSELTQIRSFYNQRFHSASSCDKEAILSRYEELYEIFSQITHNNLAINDAEKRVKNNLDEWKVDIVCNNIIHFCLAVACALPLVAGIIVLPFVLPVISLDFFIGAAILTAASSSIFLALNSCFNNLADMESTKPVRKNSIVELSFLNNLNKLLKVESTKDNEKNNDEHSDEGAELYVSSPCY